MVSELCLPVRSRDCGREVRTVGPSPTRRLHAGAWDTPCEVGELCVDGACASSSTHVTAGVLVKDGHVGDTAVGACAMVYPRATSPRKVRIVRTLCEKQGVVRT